jgi:small neutral amino acid transporter SnatA (MarC family)
VNELQRLVNKNALEAAQRLTGLLAEVAALKATVAGLQKTMEQLQAAQKPASAKNPESK